MSESGVSSSNHLLSSASTKRGQPAQSRVNRHSQGSTCRFNLRLPTTSRRSACFSHDTYLRILMPNRCIATCQVRTEHPVALGEYGHVKTASDGSFGSFGCTAYVIQERSLQLHLESVTKSGSGIMGDLNMFIIVDVDDTWLRGPWFSPPGLRCRRRGR